MASAERISPDRYVVHLASQSKSEVAIEVHMSRETAARIVANENARLAQLNPGLKNVPPATLGAAAMSVLSLFAVNGKV